MNEINEKINVEYSNKFPDDYHTDVLEEYYKGELKRKDGTYYKQIERKKYYTTKEKHLCPGHWQGYRFVIQNYSPKNGNVFDPCLGSGTTIVESINNNRNGYGIELEYSHIAKKNVEDQNSKMKYKIYDGDMRNINEIILEDISFDLIVTGTPYMGVSDSPQRPNTNLKNKFNHERSFYYNKELPNFAWLSEKEYYKEIKKTYEKILKYLKKNGYFSIIIKDTMKNKKPYLLHYNLTNEILKIPGIKLDSIYLHKHLPKTLFMNTYPKRYPGIKIPLYQTIVIFKKVK